MSQFEFYFGSSTLYNLYSNQNQRLTNILNNNFYIYFNFFYNLSTSLIGGALFILNLNSLLLINNNIFSYCSSTTTNAYSGAIYLSINQLIMIKNCGDNCFSTTSSWPGGGQFICINSTVQNCTFNLTSIFKCSPSDIGRSSSICIINSKVNISDLNSSNNVVSGRCSHLLCYSSASYLLYCNYINGYSCISLGFHCYYSKIFNNSFSNFINNSQYSY